MMLLGKPPAASGLLAAAGSAPSTGGFPRIRCTCFGGPHNKDYIIFGGSIEGSPYSWETTTSQGKFQGGVEGSGEFQSGVYGVYTGSYLQSTSPWRA